METFIPAAAYSSPEDFQREQEQIFQRQWQFAGFTSQLTQHEDFITCDLAGRSVVVQNFHGELHAFQNVCSHRFSRIHQSACGNGPLRCPYHGWTYNEQGVPFCIPQKPRFDGIDQEKLSQLALQRWQIETCGQLVFIKGQGCGQQETTDTEETSLAEFLGDAYTTVEQMSSACAEMIDENRLSVKANWKILVENTLESYHVGFIHPTTFQVLGAKGMDFRFEGSHSAWQAPLKESVIKQWNRVSKPFASRPFHVEGYFHQLVFPNLTLATTHGAHFSIQTIRPVSPNETLFISYVFQSKLAKPSESQKTIVQMLGDSVVKFNRQVFEEDKDICEQVQLGATETNQAGLLSDEELRVAHFQQAYLDQIQENQTEAPVDSLSTNIRQAS